MLLTLILATTFWCRFNLFNFVISISHDQKFITIEYDDYRDTIVLYECFNRLIINIIKYQALKNEEVQRSYTCYTSSWL
ncbi:hypothetical protein BD770DRAFT_193120 [Pilaira anomala]|nr:hypothetical protein BD770DRAFT_193120 [Pilaira anomala]